VISKALEEEIILVTSYLPTYDLAGKLYQLMNP